MTKSKRDHLHRQIAHAHNAIERAIIHLNEVATPFDEQHPELANPLILLMLMLDDGNKLIEKWVAEVWGRESVNWDSWQNIPDASRPKEELTLAPGTLENYRANLAAENDAYSDSE